jgi:hypothetical protein
MLMRYHWGLAVGHLYTHQQASKHAGVLWQSANDTSRDEMEKVSNPPSLHLNHSEDQVSNSTSSHQDHSNERVSNSTSSHQDRSKEQELPLGADIAACPETQDISSDSSSDSSESDQSEAHLWEGSDIEENSECGDEQALFDFDKMYGDVGWEEYED